MKRIIVIAVGAGACVLAVLGMTFRTSASDNDQHCKQPEPRFQPTDLRCQSPQSADDCDSHSGGHGGSGAHASALSGRNEGDDFSESAGHAGFGESAGAHGGGGE